MEKDHIPGLWFRHGSQVRDLAGPGNGRRPDDTDSNSAHNLCVFVSFSSQIERQITAPDALAATWIAYARILDRQGRFRECAEAFERALVLKLVEVRGVEPLTS